ncbi:MAG: LysM peptidoglycan-binding domain-containing protein [Deltaproteobacteria bacterium]|nr:LysM peptidoglycan-binding domain-containing protein [Deltaproteobacteria bacterium]
MSHARLPIVVLAILAAAGLGRAAEITHKVGDNETLETVAKNYYGASWKAVYIQGRNGLTGKETLVGRRVVIPGSWMYTVRRGDSLTNLAKKFMGDQARYTAIMRFNNIKDAAELEIGRELLMPFHLTHTVTASDTLAQVSRRYYRTTKYASLLKEYNDADTLKPGQRLQVPVFDPATLDLRKRRYNAPIASSSTSSGEPEPVVSPALEAVGIEARPRLDAAIAAYVEGNYEDACTALDNLLEENKVIGADRTLLFKHLGFCAIAYGDQNGARDYFRKWLELDSKASLDPILTSPKILAVFYEVSKETHTADKPSPPPAPETPTP